ncbi:MAG: hypothetical protein L3J36_12665 [Rhodobacteraceae bacterium]|nr:hypothetical protein [Paracoccaceae bacterium]
MNWLSSPVGPAFMLLVGLALLGSPGTGLRAETQRVQSTSVSGFSPASMAIGLAPVNDWSVQQPFLNVMKTARRWIGHKPRQWGGVEHDALAKAGLLDDAGWPMHIPDTLGSIGTLILTDLPEQAQLLAGRYRLTFSGQGIVEVSGRVRNVRYGKGQVLFDFTPGPGHVDIRIQRNRGRKAADYVRDIAVVKLDHVDAYEAGAIFNPDWLARLKGFKVLRFMDWMETNHSTQAAWANRPKTSDFSWGVKGVPLEIMLALSVRTGTDPWFNMPHLADDDYVTHFATMTRDSLPPERNAYVEFSNEVWNWGFAQTTWADTAARTEWGARDAGVQYYGVRAAEVAQIWTGIYGIAAPERLINVISTQTGWLGLEEMLLNAPARPAGTPTPAEAFQAYAVTGYFGGVLGTEQRSDLVHNWIRESLDAARQSGANDGLMGEALQTYIAAHKYDLATTQAALELRDGSVSGDPQDTLKDLLGRTLPYHAEVARKYGLDLIMYEGGTHVVGIGLGVDDPVLTGFFTHLNYTREMGGLYTTLIHGWRDLGGRLFNVFSDVSRPSKWGSWGALRFLSDSNPRWDAIVAAQ